MSRQRRIKQPENLHGYAKILLIVMVAVGLQFMSPPGAFGHSPDVPRKKFKILHVMSYHLPWVWNQDQLNGFKDALRGMNVEYKVFQMDTKRHNSEEWRRSAGKAARDLIDSWHPDLVYTNDDDAQEYVTKYYVGSNIPFVFSAVNADPEKYGFDIENDDLYNAVPTFNVVVEEPVQNFADFAQQYEINYKILKRHNPWLREPHLNNASGKTYTLEIPNKGYYKVSK